MEKHIQASTFYRFMLKIYGITLFLFDKAGNLTERYSSSSASAEFLLSFSNLKERIFNLCLETNRPQVISSELGQLWAGLPVMDRDRNATMVVIGPVFTSGGSTQLNGSSAGPDGPRATEVLRIRAL